MQESRSCRRIHVPSRSVGARRVIGPQAAGSLPEKALPSLTATHLLFTRSPSLPCPVISPLPFMHRAKCSHGLTNSLSIVVDSPFRLARNRTVPVARFRSSVAWRAPCTGSSLTARMTSPTPANVQHGFACGSSVIWAMEGGGMHACMNASTTRGITAPE